MMRWSGGNEGQTESVVAGGRTPLQGVCRRHRGWRVRVTTQCGIASAALVIVLSGNACPMIDSVAQSNVRGVAHDYDMRLAGRTLSGVPANGIGPILRMFGDGIPPAAAAPGQTRVPSVTAWIEPLWV